LKKGGRKEETKGRREGEKKDRRGIGVGRERRTGREIINVPSAPDISVPN